jgi:hypothetical protein
MQQLILSNLLEAELQGFRLERERRYQQARLAFQQELRAYDDEIVALTNTYRAAFRGVRLFRGTRAWWQYRRLHKRGDPLPPTPEGPTAEEQKRQAAAEGEQRLAAELLTTLPGDAWTLVKGYRNQKGDIDYLVIGPVGILAIDCYHPAGTILCTQDRWIRQTYDRAGAPVTQVPIQDRTGRSPSRQLNEPALHLMESLSQRGVIGEIHRAIILMHPDVRLSPPEVPTVQIFLLSHVQRLLWETCRSASRSLPLETVVEFVKEDYRQCEERRGADLHHQQA